MGASAVGIYGTDTGAEWMTEDTSAGEDFLADVVVQWEQAVSRIAELGIRVVKLRIGIVLAAEGGALPKITQPIKWWVGAPLGSGDQYMSWIHIADLCRMMTYAIDQPALAGTYNAVGPDPATNAQLTREAARVLKKPLVLPNVPAFVIKMMFGEMAGIVLGGNRVSNKKIKAAGFTYQFDTLSDALRDLLHR